MWIAQPSLLLKIPSSLHISCLLPGLQVGAFEVLQVVLQQRNPSKAGSFCSQSCNLPSLIISPKFFLLSSFLSATHNDVVAEDDQLHRNFSFSVGRNDAACLLCHFLPWEQRKIAFLNISGFGLGTVMLSLYCVWRWCVLPPGLAFENIPWDQFRSPNPPSRAAQTPPHTVWVTNRHFFLVTDLGVHLLQQLVLIILINKFRK